MWPVPAAHEQVQKVAQLGNRRQVPHILETMKLIFIARYSRWWTHSGEQGGLFELTMRRSKAVLWDLSS